MLDKPAHQESESVLEELTEEDAYIISMLPLAVQEIEDAARRFDQAGEMYRASTARLKASTEKLQKASDELRRMLGKPIPLR